MEPMLGLMVLAVLAVLAAWVPTAVLQRRMGAGAPVAQRPADSERHDPGPRDPGLHDSTVAQEGSGESDTVPDPVLQISAVIRATGWVLGLTALTAGLMWALVGRSDIGGLTLLLLAALALLAVPAWWLLRRAEREVLAGQSEW